MSHLFNHFSLYQTDVCLSLHITSLLFFINYWHQVLPHNIQLKLTVKYDLFCSGAVDSISMPKMLRSAIRTKCHANDLVAIFFWTWFWIQTHSRFPTLIGTEVFHHCTKPNLQTYIYLHLCARLRVSAVLGEGFHADNKALEDGHMPAEFGTTQKTNAAVF